MKYSKINYSSLKFLITLPSLNTSIYRLEFVIVLPKKSIFLIIVFLCVDISKRPRLSSIAPLISYFSKKSHIFSEALKS